MIGLLLSTLTSIYGIFAFGVGLLLFFMVPMVPRTLGIMHRLSHLHLWLGARMLKRAAVVVSEHGDLLLKRMSPNDVGTEEIEFGDTTKEFEDPHQAKSNWMGISFAFADEVHGFFFSLRDAAMARREKEAEERDELVIKATEAEQSMYEVMGWQKAVYEFPAGVYELVDLNHIRELITGVERGEHPARVETYYKNSRLPYKEGPGTARILLLLVALLAPFGATFFIWQETSGAGGGTSVITGSLALLMLSKQSVRETIHEVDWKALTIHLLKVAVVVVPLPAVFIGIAFFAGPNLSMILLIIMALGFMFVPFLVEILKASDGITDRLSSTLLKMGFLAYSEPVFVETARGYTVREFETLEHVDDEQIVWHTLLGRKFGFTFDPTEDLWGTEVADHSELENTMIGDGGPKTNIPAGYSVIPEKQRAVYGSFVPTKIQANSYYLWTGVALQRFANVATGKKTFKRLEKAKEEHGEDDGLSDKGLITAVALLGSLSLISGILVFFLLIGV